MSDIPIHWVYAGAIVVAAWLLATGMESFGEHIKEAIREAVTYMRNKNG